jgi:hypothetical protein
VLLQPGVGRLQDDVRTVVSEQVQTRHRDSSAVRSPTAVPEGSDERDHRKHREWLRQSLTVIHSLKAA